MANTFNRIVATSTSAGSTLATVPASATWVVIGIQIANDIGSLVTVSIDVASTTFLKDIPIPVGSTLGALEGKIVLKEGDTIEESCSMDDGVKYIISYMEMT